MGIFSRGSADWSGLPPTVVDALDRMEREAGGRIKVRDLIGLLREQVVPALGASERVDLIAVCTYRLGFDPATGHGEEFVEGVLVTGEDAAYLAWVDGPGAERIPYASISDVEQITVGLDTENAPGLVVRAANRWLMIFTSNGSGAGIVPTVQARLNGGIRPTWEDAAPTAAPRARRRPSAAAVGAIVIAAVLAVGAYLLTRPDDVEFAEVGDHIHIAIGINACGEWLELSPNGKSMGGLDTYGDGVIHVHPTFDLGDPSNATLEFFLQDVSTRSQLGWDGYILDMAFLRPFSEATDPGGACAGLDPAAVRTAYWHDVNDPDEDPRLRDGIPDLNLNEDGAGITIYLGEDDDVPRPPWADELSQRGAVDASSPG